MDEDPQHNSLDWQDWIPSDEELKRMHERGEGHKEIARRWYRMRAMMGMAMVFEHLNIVPPAKVQAECVYVMLECLWKVPEEVVLQWSKNQADWLNRQEDGGGHA